MKFPTELIPGRLLRRYKRFLADVRLDSGEEVVAHCPNPGSMLGLATEGARVLLSPAQNPKRKLKFSWELVDVEGSWVLVNTARPNAIVREAIEEGIVSEFTGYETIRAEVKYGKERSRVDFLLSRPQEQHYLEVKSATLAVGSIGYFPDAVTTRGTRHLRELAGVVAEGDRASLLFAVCRPDVRLLRPADNIDPEYGRTLRQVAAAGVAVLAYGAEVSPEGVRLTVPLPVDLGNHDGGPVRPKAAKKSRPAKKRSAKA